MSAHPTQSPGGVDPIEDSTASARERLTSVVCAQDPSDGLWDLVLSGWADEHLPELTALALEQDPVHRHKDVLAHTIEVTARVGPRLRVRLAALFHDIGKPKTRRFTDSGVTFYHHEAVGARMTTRRLSTLGFDPATVQEVSRLVEVSGRFHGYGAEWSDAAVRRYARDAGPLLGDLNELVRCDCTTRRPGRVLALERQVEELEDRIRALAAKDREASRRPALDGNEIMSILGVGPGPHVGEAIALLDAANRAEADIDRTDCEAILEEWWAGRH